jgi:glycosyltransferase involved in cell wall biosynthesis
MQRPEISILMPLYNADSTLPTALKSVLRQSLAEWECIVIDDGSTDASLAVAQAYAARDTRIRVLARGHSGIVPALNDGLCECRGQWVARFDADDVMHRQRLAEQRRQLLAHPELSAVGCHVSLFPRARLSPGLRGYAAWLNSLTTAAEVARDRFVECPLAHPTLCVRRSALHDFGYRDVPWPEDYDLLLRMFGSGAHLGVVPRRLLAWRDGPARLSRIGPAYTRQQLVQCKAEFLARDWLARRGQYVLWGYGDTGRTLGRALDTRGKRPTHIIELHPGRLGQRVLGARVITPAELEQIAPRPERIIVSVAGAGPRGEIRESLASMGFVEGRDFVCAA